VGFLLIAFVVARRRKFDGQVFLSYVAWYGIGRFGIESLRTDSLYVLGTGLRVSQLLAGVSALAAIGLIAFGLWYGKAHGFRPLYVEKVQEQGNEKEKDDYAGENS
jgi:phosphatidylglycerol:prolipoprotein diacylglycerol transferase